MHAGLYASWGMSELLAYAWQHESLGASHVGQHEASAVDQVLLIRVKKKSK